MSEDIIAKFADPEFWLRECYRKRVNVTMVYDPSQEKQFHFGIRLTPWGANPEGIMYYGAGEHLRQAAQEALGALLAGEALVLDYSYRGDREGDTDDQS